MRSCFVLLFASLLTSCEAQGTIETPVFVLKGRDLLLELHADPPEGLIYVDWKINKSVNLVRFDPSGKANVLHNVTGGFEFPENKFSVILKNLQEADSGVYSAAAFTLTGDKLLAEYKVTVQGPVSPVKLTVDRVDSSISESCDLHVTCRTHNSHISSTFKCVDRVCSQEGGERSEVTTSGASLQVYLLNSTIICNHSNQVHWTQDFNTTEHLCTEHADPLSHSGWVIAIFIVTLVIVIMFVVLIVWLHHQRRLISSRHKQQRITSASPQMLSPEDDDPDLRRRFEDLVRSVILDKINTYSSEEAGAVSLVKGTDESNTTSPLVGPLTEERTVRMSKRTIRPHGGTRGRNPQKERERQWLDLLNNKAASGEKMISTPEPPQMLSIAEDADPDVGRRFKDLINDAFPRAALHQVFRPEDPDPDLGRRFENLVSSVLQKFTSAPHQDESPADPDSDLRRRFKNLVSSVILKFTSAPHQDESPEDPDSDLGRSFKNLVNDALPEELKRQFLDHLNKKKASREKMEDGELQLLDHLTKKAALGEEMTNLELQLLDHLNKKAALGEKMEELELLNV